MQPIYNLLVVIYGILPGNDLGISLILFTALVRVLLWPLLKKQLHQGKVMRELQPEIKKVKKAAAGDRQKEAALMMELYKEKGISPFGSIGLLIIQLPIFIGVFQAARKLTEEVDQLSTFTYQWVRDIPHIHEIVTGEHGINFTSLGFIDLSQKAISDGAIYLPILAIGILATVFQFIQSRQIMPQQKEKKKLRDIMRESAATGKQPEQEDMTAAMGGTMLYLMPILTIMFILYAQGAMIMYLFASSVIGILQQTLILRQDSHEMIEQAEVVSVKKQPVAPEKTAPTTKPSKQVKTKKQTSRGKVATKSRIVSGNTKGGRR